jgi:hypothetical protein
MTKIKLWMPWTVLAIGGGLALLLAYKAIYGDVSRADIFSALLAGWMSATALNMFETARLERMLEFVKRLNEDAS